MPKDIKRFDPSTFYRIF